MSAFSRPPTRRTLTRSAMGRVRLRKDGSMKPRRLTTSKKGTPLVMTSSVR
jgi:hypothetical protein